jgi:hypothetical protein
MSNPAYAALARFNYQMYAAILQNWEVMAERID